MAVRVSVASLSREQKIQIGTELTFKYKEQTMLKKKRYHEETKEVSAYLTERDVIALPMAWARTEFEVENDPGEQRKFKSILKPRDKKQTRELQQVIDLLEENQTTALTIRTGAGKTAISLFCACYFRGLTVILVHIDDHCKQWANSITEFTNAKYEIITSDTNGIKYETDIIICLYTRWMHVPKVVRRNIHLLVIDECDEFNNTTGIQSILAFTPRLCLGCTATFKRSGTGLETIMHSVLGYEFVSSAFDVDYTVTKVLTGIQGIREDSKYTHGVDWLVLYQSLLYNPERNALLVELVKIRHAEGRKSIVITNEKKHVKILYELIKATGISVDYLSGNKRGYKDSKVLVVTDKRGGRGFDEKSYCADWGGERINNVILASFVANEEKRIQMIGRGMRAANPNIDHLVDDDKTVVKQYNAAEESYLSMGAIISEMELC